MASNKKAYVDYVEDDDDYYSGLAGDFSVGDRGARNKRNNGTCYSTKHVRVSQACKVAQKSNCAVKSNK
jgi:hypothetical protein